MKPTKLTISAFGSYADVQTIDFAKLGDSGLYLITGETGSGKTTIFDAISFALFGKASGTGRANYSMLRSDFAPEKSRTYVELEFLSGDRKYNIKRTIKNTGQDVVLDLPGGVSISGDRNVKMKIAETVGLDRDQFAQIVMIAQNDFLRFLQSDTSERLKILRTIFDTGTLRQFQEYLKELVRRGSEKRALILHDFARYEVDVYKRDEQFARWEAQIKSDTEILSEINKQIREHDKIKQDLAAKSAVAEELCKKFSDLALFRREQQEHNAKTAAYENGKIRAERGTVALHKVKPLDDEAKKSAANHASAYDGLTSAKVRAAADKKELDEAVKAADALPPLCAAQDAFAVLLKKWEAAIEKLKNLKKLQNDFSVIKTKQAELIKEQEKLNIINDTFNKADERYRRFQEAFIRSQSGIIADGLISGEPCPVCGSTEHPAPAGLPKDSVTETMLKEARLSKEKIQSDRETKSSVCGILKAETDTLIKRLYSDFSIHIPDTETEPTESVLSELLLQTKNETEKLTTQKETEKAALDAVSTMYDTAVKRKTDAASAVQSAQTLVNEREKNEQMLLKLRNETQTAYKTALKENGFSDEAEYKTMLVTESELSNLRQHILNYEKHREQLTRDITRLASEISGKKQPDIEKLRSETNKTKSKLEELNEKRDEINKRLGKTRDALKELQRAAVEFEKVEKAHSAVRQLSDAANGRLDFETYAQMAYFERVLNAANLRLKVMSQNRYTLLRKTESYDGRRRSGLEIEVLDAYTGRSRSSGSLSGGESFMASLSLALGLSDVVQQSVGGIRLDAMFIDEGFGTLDAGVLDLAVRTLSEMAGTNRIIGIISHVAELSERIDKQIRVEKTPFGSRIRITII